MKLTPYYERDGITIYHGSCLDLGPSIASDAIVTDPPYGVTDLGWDVPAPGWLAACSAQLSAIGSAWIFGSMRSLLAARDELAGWTVAQDVVWEKQNGSGLHVDRFRRVHELAVHVYRGPWAPVWRDVQYTHDATRRTVRRREKPSHWGRTGEGSFTADTGGPRLMRSVMHVRSCHGEAVFPTQKPLGILEPLIRYSCPPGGIVFDPFGGSGSTLLAARASGRRAVMCENVLAHCDLAIARLAQGVFGYDDAARTA